MKLWNAIAFMLGMMIFLYFLGFNFGFDAVLSGVGISINSTNMSESNVDISNSDWSDLLFNPVTGLLIGLGAAIVIGFYTKTFDFKIALLGFFTSFIVLFASFGFQMVELAKSGGEDWLVGVSVTVFGLITAMFIVSIVEWFGGSPSD